MKTKIQDLLKAVAQGEVHIADVRYSLDREIFTVHLESIEQADVLAITITLPIEVFDKYTYPTNPNKPEEGAK